MPATRDTLVNNHLGLVHYLARRLWRTLADEAELDELVSAGLVGLLNAADSFDPARGLAFSTYAATRIRGAMLDELRRLDPLTRTARERVRRLDAARDRLAQRLHRAPDTHEIAADLGVHLHDLLDWERDALDAQPLSLEHPSANPDDRPASPHERVPADPSDLDLELDRERERERLREALHTLDHDAREILRLSYFEDLSLRDIAPRLGITESGASRLRTRALKQLHHRLTPHAKVA